MKKEPRSPRPRGARGEGAEALHGGVEHGRDRVGDGVDQREEAHHQPEEEHRTGDGVQQHAVE